MEDSYLGDSHSIVGSRTAAAAGASPTLLPYSSGGDSVSVHLGAFKVASLVASLAFRQCSSVIAFAERLYNLAAYIAEWFSAYANVCAPYEPFALPQRP